MAKTVVVRYRIRPDAVEENVRLVQEVYAALAELKPEGFRYATYRLADGETFLHIAQHEESSNPLATLPAFAEFQRDLMQRCSEPPQPSEASLVGSYRVD